MRNIETVRLALLSLGSHGTGTGVWKNENWSF